MDPKPIKAIWLSKSKTVQGSFFLFLSLCFIVAFSVMTFVCVSERKGICFRTFKNTDNVTKRHLAKFLLTFFILIQFLTCFHFLLKQQSKR